MRLRDRLDRKKRRPSTRNQRIGFAFFWLLVLSFAYVTSSSPNWNTESHLYTAFSIVDHHALNIDAYHTRLGDESYYRSHYYSDKAPGLSFLAVPVYAGLRLVYPGARATGYQAFPHQRFAVGRNTVYVRYAVTYFLVVVPSALLAIALWLLLTPLVGSSAWALALAGAYALGTIAYPYSTWFFSHQITAILLFSSFLLLFHRVRGAAWSRNVLLSSALAGLLAGYAFISEYPTIMIGGLLAGYGLLVSPCRARAVCAYAAGSLPAVGLLLGYDWAAFGSPFVTGYSHVSSMMYHSSVRGGFLNLAVSTMRMPDWGSAWEITFGTYRGLFLLCPILLLFFPGLLAMWRRRELRPELWLCLVVVVAYFLMDASRGVNQNGWSGGWSVASRHLTPVIPFMILPVAFVLRRRAGRIAFVPLAAVSVALMFMSVVSVGMFSYADHNPIANELFPGFFHGHMQLTWGYLIGLHGLSSLMPYACVAALLVARIVWLFRRPERAFLRAVDVAGAELQLT